MSDTKLIFLHALTPVHSGTGQTAAVIDLPIAREQATGYPMIPASSIKGVMRDALLDSLGEETVNRVFGAPERAGALCFTDQRLLCLPVRSYFGTYAYVTCPLALHRITRDFAALGNPLILGALGQIDDLAVITSANTALTENRQGYTIYLEDLDLTRESQATADLTAKPLAEILFPDNPTLFTERFALVSNEVFSFLCETATEVTARIELNNDTKTTKNLWYEEAAPAESIFCGAAVVQANDQSARSLATGVLQANDLPLIQIGGNASVGRGLCRVVVKS